MVFTITNSFLDLFGIKKEKNKQTNKHPSRVCSTENLSPRRLPSSVLNNPTIKSLRTPNNSAIVQKVRTITIGEV